MIKVNKIVPFTCECFTPNGVSLGFLNDFEFNDIRIQIKNEKAKGYYMVFEDEEIEITEHGRCTAWPVGFYDMWENQLAQIL